MTDIPKTVVSIFRHKTRLGSANGQSFQINFINTCRTTLYFRVILDIQNVMKFVHGNLSKFVHLPDLLKSSTLYSKACKTFIQTYYSRLEPATVWTTILRKPKLVSGEIHKIEFFYYR